MRIDDFLTDDERKVIEYLKNKNRMEQDEILHDYERKGNNG